MTRNLNGHLARCKVSTVGNFYSMLHTSSLVRGTDCLVTNCILPPGITGDSIALSHQFAQREVSNDWYPKGMGQSSSPECLGN